MTVGMAEPGAVTTATAAVIARVPGRCAALLAWMAAAGGIAWGGAAVAQVDEDPVRYIEFTQDFTGHCVARQGVQILVRSTHPTRSVRVWLDRYHMGTGTGDRSRSELRPQAEPEPLGCSRTTHGPQEWRVVRASFVD